MLKTDSNWEKKAGDITIKNKKQQVKLYFSTLCMPMLKPHSWKERNSFFTIGGFYGFYLDRCQSIIDVYIYTIKTKNIREFIIAVFMVLS